MKAIAVVPGKREVRLIDEEVPRLQAPEDVKLKMLEVGVCGTDKEICAFEYGTPPPGLEHLVIGHESLAEVVEVGPGVTRLKVGDLVVPMVRRPCPHAHCVPCRAGRQDFCSTGDFRERGIKERHGFMTEFVVDHETYMNPVPRTLRDVAVLVEPLTIAEKSLIQLRTIQQRLPWGCQHGPDAALGHCHRALVLGAGPVGLLGAMALITAGFETTVYSREEESHPKAELVRSLGGHYVSGSTHDVAALAKSVGGIDLVYEAVGSSRLAFGVMAHLASNGVFVFTGVPALKGPIEVDTDSLMRNMVLRNQLVLGTVNAGRDAFEAAIRDLGVFQARWPKAVAALLTGRFPVEAYDELLRGPATGIKNVISMGASA
jgi:glucose 1-dehydrogenase